MGERAVGNLIRRRGKPIVYRRIWSTPPGQPHLYTTDPNGPDHLPGHSGAAEPGYHEPVECAIVDVRTVREYRRALFRVRTIVPTVKQPMMNTYILSHGELEDFLVGYGEYAEFIIGVERIEPS